MKAALISLKRSLEVSIKDTIIKIKELGDKESQALREEYKEWLEACECENKYSYVLYKSQMKPRS